ncbi:hypothetical protein GOBAR_AA35443 [Gossypium barbadense]|uniref:Uncharacterized protein n=1 Tax=Gossypium barbadense TaxID=3634 RepID=A0A2P5W2D1_GOSBA|nr:hypothetical protein GOBAR_AA35443 [Gossypium barbadense]
MSYFNTAVSHGRVSSPVWPWLQACPIAEQTALSSTCDVASSFLLLARSSFKNFAELDICERTLINGAMNPSLSWALITLRCSLGLGFVLLVLSRYFGNGFLTSR